MDLRTFSIPLRHRFRRVGSREGVLLRGDAGWGEFSPFPDYGPEVAATWLAAAREAAEQPFPPAVRDRIPVNATVPAVDPDTAHALAAGAGCDTVKVKVAEAGQQLADDLDRVAAVRAALGPRGSIRVDANGAWDVSTAAHALERLQQAAGGLEYAEQPCATLDELAQLRHRVAVALAADESIRTAADPLRVAGLDAADVIVVKVQPLGGVRRALEVVEAAGLPAVVSSAVETSIGLAAGVALAAALPQLHHACGLGTATLLAGDVTTEPLEPVAGELTVRRPICDPALLDQWAPGPEASLELLERLQAADRAAATAGRVAAERDGGHAP
jgi:o-succinylbenzoate synthase